MIYVVILVFVMLFVNLFFHSENIETEIAVAIPAAFIAFCAGYRTAATSAKKADRRKIDL
ncbi:MAG: hypothetical protein IKE91_01065 [Clostridia bacterium]|nr:hypothetical protein [Clostridia bacterium]